MPNVFQVLVLVGTEEEEVEDEVDSEEGLVIVEGEGEEVRMVQVLERLVHLLYK